MEIYESDMEGDEQETPLLPGARQEITEKVHKGDFL